MLSVRVDRPVDPLTVAILREANRVAVELGVPYFVLGAMARDILLTHVHGLDPERATRDIDLAIALDSWSAFETFKGRLVDMLRSNPAIDSDGGRVERLLDTLLLGLRGA